jgi:hypothetical protein
VVNAGALAALSVSGPSSVTAGGTATFTATGYDAEGNSLGVQTASWSISTGAGGSWSGNVYTSQTAGSWTVTGSVSGVAGTASLTVNAAATASKLVFTAGAGQSLTAGVVSPTAIVVQRQDAYGNPVSSGTSAITVSLSTTSSGGKFYSNSGGTTVITSITIAAGSSSSAGFYYKDTVVGTPTLTGASSGLTSATTQFTINNYQLVFSGGASQALTVGTMSSQITIQSETSTGGHYTVGTTITVNLATTSTGGAFYATSTSTTPITTVSIVSGSYSATFYYKDSTAGTPTLTASSSGYTPATTTFTITGTATQLVFTAGTSQSLCINTVSSVITVTREDVARNAVTSGGSITVNLATNTTTGSFYNNAGGTGTAITSIAIASGSSSANFYYKNTGTGSSIITASYTGLTSATTTFTQNLLINGGFTSATGGWTTSSTAGSGVECHIQSGDPITAHSGSTFAEIDTTDLSSSTSAHSAFSALTQTLSSPVPVSSFNEAGSLSIWICNNGWSTQATSDSGYYSFEIIVTASNGNQLIYWWGNSPATPPTSSATTAVINEGSLPGMFTVGQWVQFSTNLYQDWTTHGLSSSASITSLAIQDNGYYQSSAVQYGQELFLDDVVLQ